MGKPLIRIATRKSPLALWQANYVSERLRQAHPQLEVRLIKMLTQGDKNMHTPLAAIGGKGLFIKELEQGMIDGAADIAVHSMKDMPAVLPDGFELAAVCERGEPLDAWVSPRYADIAALPPGACVGTASLRRRCQLLAARPDLKIHHLRGNVQTRLAKLESNGLDAIILACAGLTRLQLQAHIRYRIPAHIMLPAIGQGAIGIECRQDDAASKALVGCLNHADSHRCITAERALSLALGCSCQAPVGGYARLQSGELWLRGLVADVDGKQVISAEIRGRDALAIGQALAEQLLQRGGARILAQLNGG